MKSRFLLAAAALLAAPLASAAEGPLKEKALALSKSYKDSVLFLSAVVELEVTAGDNPAKKEERKIEMLGTVLNKDGLIVERDAQDVNRLDAKIPVDVVNGLHVFAGRIDLLL